MTKTLRTLVCALALVGAVAVTPRTGAATPAQTVAATTATTVTTATSASQAATTGGTAVAADRPVAASGLSVSRLVIATGVSEREPLDPASAFSLATTSHVYAFVELANPSAEATTVEVAWLDVATGKERRSYSLEVKAHKRWRTWARSTLPKKPGAWAVLVRDANGVELARSAYEVIE
ncbi:MAG TPA: DUF2914 domain-containing protein [Polyangiales bacterium]|nr:DUF2914 domain-containing protein [Polyangiales bacterium]